jgi:heme/copper-type cytochrome/quinol oxidase subunit 2
MMLRAAQLVVVWIVALGSLAAQEQAPNRRDFKIVAKNHTFTPNRIEVAQDDLVKVTFTSEDRPASFAVDAYRIAKRAAGGETITFEFRADQPGTFTFYCNLTTDEGCKNMRGTLVVNKR